MNKAELRKIYLSKRRELTPGEIAEKSRLITQVFFENIDLTGIGFLHCYIPIHKFNEVNTNLIITALWSTRPEIGVVVPKVVSKDGELESRLYAPETQLLESAWGIREPPAGAAISPAEIGLVLVPGLAFALDGHRVGYGKGYYDRFLSQCRPDCLKIGLSFFPPIDVITDVHEGDVRLDLAITPDAVYRTDPEK